MLHSGYKYGETEIFTEYYSTLLQLLALSLLLKQGFTMFYYVSDGQTFPGDPFVARSVQEATVSVNRAINNTLAEVRDPNRRRTPEQLLTLFRLPSHEALEVTRAAEIYERSLEIIIEHVRRGHMFNVTESCKILFFVRYHITITEMYEI